MNLLHKTLAALRRQGYHAEPLTPLSLANVMSPANATAFGELFDVQALKPGGKLTGIKAVAGEQQARAVLAAWCQSVPLRIAIRNGGFAVELWIWSKGAGGQWLAERLPFTAADQNQMLAVLDPIADSRVGAGES